ncbi:MAG: acetyl-CoA decarbonylase/synthase complex subunit gamma [Candidatus Omnitrophota bacterium]
MALSGLDIYKKLAKTNCRDCGFPTCLAFAMQVAAKKIGLDKCPHLSEDVKNEFLESSAPPMKLVVIGTGDSKIEIGRETVMFRHEETFYHPTAIGVSLKDSLSEDDIKKKIEKINSLAFERVGQKLKVELIAIVNEGAAERFEKAVRLCVENSQLNLVLMSADAGTMEAALKICADRRPLIYAADENNYESFAGLAKKYNTPLAVLADDLVKLSEITKKIKGLGVDELVIGTPTKDVLAKINDLTYARRAALKHSERSLGFPQMAVIENLDDYQKVLQAAGFVCKYANILILDTDKSEHILPILTAAQNIYTDPQKPLAVKPAVYEIGQVSQESPVLVTTNFSLTYYTVETEVQSSRVPSYIISVDCDGMSVLTAWAADKFTAESINAALKQQVIEEKINHKKIIIPGYVANLRAKLEEEFGWKVIVGPREASALPGFLKNLK